MCIHFPQISCNQPAGFCCVCSLLSLTVAGLIKVGRLRHMAEGPSRWAFLGAMRMQDSMHSVAPQAACGCMWSFKFVMELFMEKCRHCLVAVPPAVQQLSQCLACLCMQREGHNVWFAHPAPGLSLGHIVLLLHWVSKAAHSRLLFCKRRGLISPHESPHQARSLELDILLGCCNMISVWWRHIE
jgi:hypothetical protein